MQKIHKVLPIPPQSVGVIISGGSSRLEFKITCITPPMELPVSIAITGASLDLYLNQTYCQQCTYFKSSGDVLDLFRGPGVSNSQLLEHSKEYYKEHNLCPGSNKLGTSECKAGHTSYEEINALAQVANVKLPYLGWTCSFTRRAFDWKLHTFRDESFRELTAYVLANVHSHGGICWGKARTPADHYSAFQTFFCSAFNSDLTGLCGERSKLKERLETFDIAKEIEKLNRNWYDSEDLLLFQNASFKALVKQPGSSILLSNAAKYIEVLPKRRTYDSSAGPLAIGAINKLESGGYLIDFRGFKVLSSSLTAKSKLTPIGTF